MWSTKEAYVLIDEYKEMVVPQKYRRAYTDCDGQRKISARDRQHPVVEWADEEEVQPKFLKCTKCIKTVG